MYKIARDYNKITGVSPKCCPYYQEFDEVLGTGDVVNTPFEKEMGCWAKKNLWQKGIKGCLSMLLVTAWVSSVQYFIRSEKITPSFKN